MPRVPLHPKHPERTCWGCNLYCPADDLRCGSGTIRTPHPIELFGDDWLTFGLREAGSHQVVGNRHQRVRLQHDDTLAADVE